MATYRDVGHKKQISSRFTFFAKTVFPIFWFGFLAIFITLNLLGGIVEQSPMFLIVPVAMIVMGYFLMKRLVWDLRDEVIDHGEYLSVMYRGQKDHIYLSNIMNVSVSTNQNPPRITLQLRTPGKFGTEVAFYPVSEFSLNLFKKSAIAEELILRVDKARG